MSKGFRYFKFGKQLDIIGKCDWDTTPNQIDIRHVVIDDGGANVLNDEFFQNIGCVEILSTYGKSSIPSSFKCLSQLRQLMLFSDSVDEWPPDIRMLTKLTNVMLYTKRFGTQRYAEAHNPLECKRLVNEVADFFEEREVDKARILHVMWCMRRYNKDVVRDVVACMKVIMYAKKFTWKV